MKREHLRPKSVYCQRVSHLATALALVAFLIVVPMMASACPLCKEALFDPSQLHQRISTAKGYALSIGLLLLVPTGLIAGVAMSIIRSARRAQRISRQ